MLLQICHFFPSFYPDNKSPLFCLRLILNKDDKTREEVPHRLDFNTPCVIIQRPHTRPHSLTHAAAHFLGHLFLRLFQLFEEFASQIGRIPTAPSKAKPHAAICLWSLNGVFCVYTGLPLLLPRQGSAAVQEHDSQECSPLHFNLPSR